MTVNDIIVHRLHNQQLAGTKFTQPGEVVGHFGAMQAQDYAMAKWAVGIRLGASESNIEQAINTGAIVRTHVLRPTWHFVAPADVRWMLQLSAKRIRASFAAMGRKLGLDAGIYDRCNTIIEKELSATHLTREEIMKALEKKKILTNELRSVFIMMNAELDGIVCNGAMRGKQFTYALLEEKIPAAKPFTRQEALAALAKRYFISHGPASLHDFAWWSGMSVADAKTAIELVSNHLDEITINGRSYWFKDVGIDNKVKPKGTYFLPAFDEFMVSYKDRSISLEPALVKEAITNNGIFRPIIVVDGKVVGLWTRAIKNDSVFIEAQYFYPVKKAQLEAIHEAAKKYGDYTGKKIVFL